MEAPLSWPPTRTSKGRAADVEFRPCFCSPARQSPKEKSDRDIDETTCKTKRRRQLRGVNPMHDSSQSDAWLVDPSRLSRTVSPEGVAQTMEPWAPKVYLSDRPAPSWRRAVER